VTLTPLHPEILGYLEKSRNLGKIICASEGTFNFFYSLSSAFEISNLKFEIPIFHRPKFHDALLTDLVATMPR